MAETKVLVPRGCEHCGKPFMAKTVTTHFCSKECNNKNIEDRKKKIGEQKKMAAILKKKKEVYADIQSRPFIMVSEASKLFRISEDTIRRMIRRDAIPGINLGIRLTRVDRVGLENFFNSVEILVEHEEKKRYPLDECYTIGEYLKKYNLTESILECIIKGYDIPKKQVGSYVYIPKVEIDKIINTKYEDL